jgi:hypothetical protein
VKWTSNPFPKGDILENSFLREILRGKWEKLTKILLGA